MFYCVVSPTLLVETAFKCEMARLDLDFKGWWTLCLVILAYVHLTACAFQVLVGIVWQFCEPKGCEVLTYKLRKSIFVKNYDDQN